MRIQAPRGFTLSAVRAGIKRTGKPDLGIIVADEPCPYAIAFTANHVKAAPILWNLENLDPKVVRAVLVNSGNANAGTGRQGVQACNRVADRLAAQIGMPKSQVVLASTGIIGNPLPVKKFTDAFPALIRNLSSTGGNGFSRAIMTTDTRPKVVREQVDLSGRPASVLGFAKGAGMISPRLMPHATMLSFILTDAALPTRSLRQALSKGIEASFNRITVDGDMSTNDTVVLIASGRVPVSPRDTGRITSTVMAVCRRLATAIVADGEGATKFVTVSVRGASSDRQAGVLARAVANSLLVKTALYGGDPNWGRILAALGSTGIPINPSHVIIRISGEILFSRERVMPGNVATRTRIKMHRRSIPIDIVVGGGDGSYMIHTTDLSRRYVTINAAYE